MTEEEKEEFEKTRTLAEVATTTHINRVTILAAIGREDVEARQSRTTWLLTFESLCRWVKNSPNRRYFKTILNPAFLKKYSKYI